MPRLTVRQAQSEIKRYRDAYMVQAGAMRELHKRLNSQVELRITRDTEITAAHLEINRLTEAIAYHTRMETGVRAQVKELEAKLTAAIEEADRMGLDNLTQAKTIARYQERIRVLERSITVRQTTTDLIVEFLLTKGVVTSILPGAAV